jgi:RHS repeat-associated protein
MRIEYGNGAHMDYEYDPKTFRLLRLRTLRGEHALQDLSYTFDPVGNITDLRDDAEQTIFFRNRAVEPSAGYTYDALYRLIEATGREHLGQGGGPEPTGPTDAPRVGLPQPGDGAAMGRYLERYVYDAVGNFLQMIHQGDPRGGWTRTYRYAEPSQLEPDRFSNRLTSTAIGHHAAETYTYDAHGNMTAMPHLSLMQWDFKDELQAVARQVTGDGVTPETTYYVYDGAGQRVRKLTERSQSPVRSKERLYLGGFEVYREYEDDGRTVSLERETLHVMDGQQRVALIETRTQGSDPSPAQLVRYQMSNHLGSSTLELDAQARIISYEEYYPYGSTSYQAVRSRTETPKRYRYTGKERDEESGFSYHGARYYAPWLGRWTSADPSGLADGANLYLYVSGNPVGYIDPTGNGGQPWPGFVADYPKELLPLWERAVQAVLEPRYGGGSATENVRIFEMEIEQITKTLGSLGSNRAKGTPINVARQIYKRFRTVFGRLADEAGIAFEGMQIHHALGQGIAAVPAKALDPTSSPSRAEKPQSQARNIGRHTALKICMLKVQRMPPYRPKRKRMLRGARAGSAKGELPLLEPWDLFCVWAELFSVVSRLTSLVKMLPQVGCQRPLNMVRRPLRLALTFTHWRLLHWELAAAVQAELPEPPSLR